MGFPRASKWRLPALKISLLLLAVVLLLIPLGKTFTWLDDAGLRNGQIPAFTYEWHHSLSESIGPWARERTKSGVATQLPVYDIEGT